MAVNQSLTLPTLGDQLAGDLERLDWTPALKRCAVAARSSFHENFAGSHAPDGTPWPALRFARPTGGSQPLRNFGLLAASATAQAAEGHIEDITARRLEVGTAYQSAALHQDGGTVAPRQARALSIPLTREAMRAGGARNFPGTLHREGRYLVEDRGKSRGRKGKPAGIKQYILAFSVTVPARPFIGVNDELEETMAEIVEDWTAERLAG